jgi:hypothetical protein
VSDRRKLPDPETTPPKPQERHRVVPGPQPDQPGFRQDPIRESDPMESTTVTNPKQGVGVTETVSAGGVRVDVQGDTSGIEPNAIPLTLGNVTGQPMTVSVTTGGEAEGSVTITTSPGNLPPSGVLPANVSATEPSVALPPEDITASRRTTCPHCRGKLEEHDAETGDKAFATHCNTCGCCFVPNAEGELHVRDGHVLCSTPGAAR